eukprot:4019455-Pyramimonas_sp.AAC.1
MAAVAQRLEGLTPGTYRLGFQLAGTPGASLAVFLDDKNVFWTADPPGRVRLNAEPKLVIYINNTSVHCAVQCAVHDARRSAWRR